MKRIQLQFSHSFSHLGSQVSSWLVGRMGHQSVTRENSLDAPETHHIPISRQSSADLMIVKDPNPVPITLETGDGLNKSHNDSQSQSSMTESQSTDILSKSWLRYAGHCPGLDSFLQTRHGAWWFPVKFLDALLRGVSQVVFANNPLTGLLITIALFWCDWVTGSAAVLAASVTILTAYVIGQESGNIRAGLTTYSAVLVGCVTASIWTPVYGEPIPAAVWVSIVIGSMLSVFLTSALANIFSSFKIPLPCLTLPFNVVNLLLFTCFMPPAPVSNQATEVSNATSEIVTNPETEINELDYVKLFTGIICSMGQIYGVENVFGSILMFIGVMIYSPILALMGFIGAAVGTLSGLVFISGSSYTTIYAGIWGYNAVLSATAIGGFFIAINWLSFCSAILNVILTVVIQQGLIIAFHDLRLPVFTLPFVLSTLLFLSVSSTNEALARVTNITFPELHRYEYVKRLKANADKQQTGANLTEIIVTN